MLRVHRVFRSIQGEGGQAGLGVAFIRLAGCNLRCSYCDTPEAREGEGGARRSVDELADRAAETGLARVMVTGGEPLIQPECRDLIAALVGRGLEVTVETNGSVSLEGLHPRARIVMDVKTPGSGHDAATDLANLERLRPGDEVKFVIGDRADYEWSRQFCRRHDLCSRQRFVHFSPVSGRLDPAKLAGWILEDRLPVRLNIQLHKVLWPDGEPGVPGDDPEPAG